MIEVVALGELLIDMVSTQRNVSLFNAPAFEPKAGGAPANVAVGVRRLGKASAFIGKVGADDFGVGLRAVLEAEGVETRGLLTDPHHLTTLAFVSLSDSGSPAFAFAAGAHTTLTPDEVDVGLIAGARIFHFGSVTLTQDPVRSATLYALRLAKQAGVVCSYDMNWRPALWPDGDPSLAMSVMPEVDILKMSEGELALVTGYEDPREGLAAIDLPAPLIVVTMAEKGCLYRFNGQIYAQSVPPVTNVVDATGAGDAFMAALLASLPPLEDLNAGILAQLTLRACKAGAVATTRRGAIPALPFPHDLA
jgi:fructokinase